MPFGSGRLKLLGYELCMFLSILYAFESVFCDCPKSEQKFSVAALLQASEAALKASEDESDSLKEQFQSGTLSDADFVKQFMAARKQMWLRKAKKDRLSQQQQPAPPPGQNAGGATAMSAAHATAAVMANSASIAVATRPLGAAVALPPSSGVPFAVKLPPSGPSHFFAPQAASPFAPFPDAARK